MACGELQFARLLGKKTTQKIKKSRSTIELPEAYQLEEVTYTLKEEADNGIIRSKSTKFRLNPTYNVKILKLTKILVRCYNNDMCVSSMIYKVNYLF